MKWLGQYIQNLISRFRSDVYLEDVSDHGSDPDRFLTMDSSTGKVTYRTGAEVLSDIGASSTVGDITSVHVTSPITGGGSSGDVTVAIQDASTSAKGAASFTSADFDVSSGDVSLEDTVIKSLDTDDGASTPNSHTVTIAGGEGIDTAAEDEVVTITAEEASTTNKGVVELATTAETTSGTDTGRAVTPDGLQDGYQGSTNVITLGTISTGSWRASSINTTYTDAKVESIVAGDGIDVNAATGDVTVTAETASDTNPGVVELATDAECTTGTDSTRAVTPGGLAAAKTIGQYAILRSSSFYINDNPMVQNSLYFGSAIGNTPNNWQDPQATGGTITSVSSFTISEDDMNWGYILPFNISAIEVQCSVRPALGNGDDFTLAIYTGVRSNASSSALTLTKVANSSSVVFDASEYVTNDLAYNADLNKGTMIYVGVGSEDATDAKNARGYMNITVTRR